MLNRLIAILLFLCLSNLTWASVLRENSDSNIILLNELGGNIEASIENNNPSYLNGLISSDSLVENLIPAPSSSEEQIFFQSFKEGFSNSFDLGVSIYNEMGQDGSYTFLHAYKKEGNYHLLFRMIGIGGINYHDYTLGRNKEDFWIQDIYNFFTGESMNEIMIRTYTIGRTMVNEPNADEAILLSNWTHYNKIFSYVINGKYKKALKKWSEIPDEIKNNKNQLSLSLNIAKHLDSESFNSIYKRYTQHYPESGAKYMIAIDALDMQGNLELSLACADRLDAYLFHDPIIDLIRANIYYSLGDLAKTQLLLESVTSMLPEYESSYISLLSLYLETKKYNEATVLLDQIRYNFGSYKEDLHPLLVEYPEFLRSNEYAKWIEP